MKCPLCKCKNVIVAETYPKELLEVLWNRLGVDVSLELNLKYLNLYRCRSCSLDFFDPALAGGDKFYSQLGEFEWYYLHPGKTEYDYAQQFIKTGDKILDVGAGRGVLYSKIKVDVEYTGLELSTKAVELAKAAGINVKQEDLAIHAKNNQSVYDLVCLFQVLEHLTELDNFVKDIYMALKPKGLFVIAVPDNDGFVSNTPNYLFNLPPHHSILWRESSLRFLANKFEFDVLSITREPLQDVHRDTAFNSYLISNLKKLVFKKSLLLDNSRIHLFFTRVVNKVLRNKRLKNSFYKVLERKQTDGQSIIIVLQKR
jgi:SAM-dependent methyltransferase